MPDRLKTGCALLLLSVAPAFAGTLSLAPTTVTEWKAVYGTVQARDTVPARARIGGTISELEVTEGDPVKTGQKIATVHDDKIAFQIAALDAQIRAQDAQLATAQSELTRGETLLGKGIVAAQQLDQLRTAVDVARNQIAATEAQKAVVLQQQAEGGVFAPTTGRVLTVPLTRDATSIVRGVPATPTTANESAVSRGVGVTATVIDRVVLAPRASETVSPRVTSTASSACASGCW